MCVKKQISQTEMSAAPQRVYQSGGDAAAGIRVHTGKREPPVGGQDERQKFPGVSLRRLGRPDFGIHGLVDYGHSGRPGVSDCRSILSKRIKNLRGSEFLPYPVDDITGIQGECFFRH